MENRLICTYALAKSLHEEGKDILDVFVPFILMTFYHTRRERLSEAEIKEYLKDFFNLEIPGHTIKTIITRAKRTGYLLQGNNRIQLTEKGKGSEKYFQLERDIEREVNNLLEYLNHYFKKRDLLYSKEEIAKILMTVINSNLLSLTAYLGEEPEIGIFIDLEKKAIRYTLEFFEYIEKCKPAVFLTLKKLIMGSIICILVKKDRNILQTKMDPLKVFLDTNIVFSILGYHHPWISTLARELFIMLQENKFDLYVLDFTLDEIRRVLSTYKNANYSGRRKIRVASMRSRLRNLGISNVEINEILANLEDVLLEKYNIAVFETGQLLQDYQIDEKDILLLRNYKKNSPQVSVEHDLKAIEVIKRVRGKKFGKLEKSRAIFLTSDHRLTRYNFERDHQMDSTINEVILDQLFTNVLWFKNPSLESNLPLYSVISMHSNSLFIDSNVWNKFTNLLKKMREEGKLSGFDITVLLFNNKIEEELINFEGDLSVINENFIEDLLEESQQLYREKEEKQDKTESIIRENKESLLRIKKNIEAIAVARSGFFYWGSIVFVCILITLLTYLIYIQPWASFFAWFVPIFLPIIISSFEIKFGLPFKKLKKVVYDYYLNKLTSRILGFSSLEEINRKLELLEAAITEYEVMNGNGLK